MTVDLDDLILELSQGAVGAQICWPREIGAFVFSDDKFPLLHIFGAIFSDEGLRSLPASHPGAHQMTEAAADLQAVGAIFEVAGVDLGALQEFGAAES